MQWREIGPFRGGRALAVEGVSGEPDTYYFGAVAGGVWKTVDGGATWVPIFDKVKSTASIGALAVSASDHNTIYVGTGEAAPRGNVTYGDGVYKSIDGGKNWKNVGLKDSRNIGASHRPSRKSGHCFRCGAWSSLRPKSGARNFSDN